MTPKIYTVISCSTLAQYTKRYIGYVQSNVVKIAD